MAPSSEPRRGGARVSVSLPMLLVVGSIVLCGGGAVAWSMRMQSLADEIQTKRKAMKTMHLAGRVPPNQQVMDYLTERGEQMQSRYREALALMTVNPISLEGRADPQLHFQERVHELQNTLARLASARSLGTPLVLGLPKELPPPDVAPRFLIQLAMIQEAAEAIVPIPQITQVASFKVEDPQSLSSGEDEDAFLTRLPIRIRGTTTLKGVATILAMIDRAQPVLDVIDVRLHIPKQPAADPSTTAAVAGVAATVTSPPPEVTDTLEFDCVLARYLVIAAKLPTADESATTDRKRP